MTRMDLRLVCSLLLIFSSLAIHQVAYADLIDAGAKVAWGYKGNKGPAHWASLDPAFTLCALGQAQSPININNNHIKASSNNLAINYQSAPLIIMEDGITELSIGNHQVMVNDGHSVQLNFLKDHFKEWISLQGKRYRLVQLHIHTPSENQFHNQVFPMEIHLVHQGSKGQIAVIAVFVKAGLENKSLGKIIKYVPHTLGQAETIQGERINPLDLLPQNYNHYRFMGSLTTPPCLEGVEWVVMAEPITALPAEIAALRKAMNGANARPVQALHHRPIFYSSLGGFL